MKFLNVLGFIIFVLFIAASFVFGFWRALFYLLVFCFGLFCGLYLGMDKEFNFLVKSAMKMFGGVK